MHVTIRGCLVAGLVVAAGAPALGQAVATQASTDPTRGTLSYAELLARPLMSVPRVHVQAVEPAFDRATEAFVERFGDLPPRSTETRGSGFVVDATAGLVVVASYTVENAATARVTFPDGRTFDATVVGTDADTQIGLVRIPADGLTALEWGNSDDLRVGDVVFSAGYPYNFGQAATMGIISGFPPPLEALGYQNLIMTDAPIARGNGGGPLLDSRGRVVGVCTGIVNYSGDVQLSFVVPANDAQRVVTALAAHGKVVRGTIGVIAEQNDADEDLADGLQLTPDGIKLREVLVGSGAEAAGLAAGDVIVMAAGRPIGSPDELRRLVRLADVGSQIEVTYRRNGTEHTVPVTVAPAPP